MVACPACGVKLRIPTLEKLPRSPQEVDEDLHAIAEEIDRQALQQKKAQLEAEQREKARRQAEQREKARLEAERQEKRRREKAKQEAERQEKARLEAERQERRRREKAKQEAERQEKARLEAERQEKARQEALRLERERRKRARIAAAKREKARQEKERLAREGLSQAVAKKRTAIEVQSTVAPPPTRAKYKTSFFSRLLSAKVSLSSDIPVVPPGTAMPSRAMYRMSNLLTIVFLVLILASLAPLAVWIAKYDNIYDGIAPQWARILLVLAGIQVYATLSMRVSPDWMSLWLLFLIFTGSAMFYAVCGTMTLFAPLEKIPFGLAALVSEARGWCAALLLLMLCATYLAGWVATSWKKSHP